MLVRYYRGTPKKEKRSISDVLLLCPINEKRVLWQGCGASRNGWNGIPRWLQRSSSSKINNWRLPTNSIPETAQRGCSPWEALSIDCWTPRCVTRARNDAKNILLAAKQDWRLSQDNHLCKMRAKLQKLNHKKPLHLLQASEPLYNFGMDILDPLPRSENDNTFVIVVFVFYLKLTRALPTLKTMTRHIAASFLDYWIVPHGIPDSLMTESGP